MPPSKEELEKIENNNLLRKTGAETNQLENLNKDIGTIEDNDLFRESGTEYIGITENDNIFKESETNQQQSLKIDSNQTKND